MPWVLAFGVAQEMRNWRLILEFCSVDSKQAMRMMVWTGEMASSAHRLQRAVAQFGKRGLLR